MDSKFNKFSDKKEFVEEFKRRIIERYGRSIEEAHITEKYIVLGKWSATMPVSTGKTRKMPSRGIRRRRCIIFPWNF